MRGFTQNIRNGNNFAVINSEIRWPFIKYFSRYPASSNFWSSLQAVGFFDVGSAWTGWTPFSGGNAYEYDIVKQNPITIYVDSNRSPIVYGFGYGLRAQVLGYFMRFDWAYGVEKNVILPRIFYFSLSTDF
jgi:outer membrane protein assembly factor BamA